jgi:hypothetical protein
LGYPPLRLYVWALRGGLVDADLVWPALRGASLFGTPYPEVNPPAGGATSFS